MLEPDVTLTDYALAVQCAIFALLIRRKSGSIAWQWLFGSLAAASLLGGTVHGFLPDEMSLAQQILWRGTLVATGVTVLAGWYAVASLVGRPWISRWIEAAAIVQFAAFSIVATIYSQRFLFVLVNYLPMAVTLLAALTWTFFRTAQKYLLFGIAGMTLTFLASGLQASMVEIHPVLLSHNALYHVVQFIAFLLLFLMVLSDMRQKHEKPFFY